MSNYSGLSVFSPKPENYFSQKFCFPDFLRNHVNVYPNVSKKAESSSSAYLKKQKRNPMCVLMQLLSV